MTDVLAFVEGARKGRGRELGCETTREGGGMREKGNFLPRAPHALSRAKKFPFPLLTPATQATDVSKTGAVVIVIVS